jgi:hypothetical protein
MKLSELTSTEGNESYFYLLMTTSVAGFSTDCDDRQNNSSRVKVATLL